MLDYCDAQGGWLGSASRKAVHAGGLWHRTLHLWLATPDDGGSLLYQLRADTTANWPGKLDVTVAGHLLAGEGYREAMRESKEEIGIAVPVDAVVFFGERREEHPDPAGGWNRELQGVHMALLDPAWGDFDAVDGEAAGLFRISHADAVRLHGGAVSHIACEGLVASAGRVLPCRREVTVSDFVPRPGYYPRLHAVAARLARGEPAAKLVEEYERHQ